MSEPVLIADSLTVRYGKRVAVDRLSFTFGGGCLGLLGRNGAGKSSFLRAALGLVKPASGRAVLLGLEAAHDGKRVRRNVGYMPERECHIPGLTGVEFVSYCGRLAGLSVADARRRSHEMLAYVGLREERYRKVDDYSRGMKQRAKLAAALVHDPALLFLDEPTNGLDPRSRREFLATVQDLTRNKNIHVVLSSHLLQDVESVANDVLVMDQGQLRATGPIQGLLARDAGGFVVKVHGEWEPFQRELEAAGHSMHRDARHQWIVRPAADAAPLSIATLFALGRRSGTLLREVVPEEETLEDLFLRALQRPAGEASSPAAETR